MRVRIAGSGAASAAVRALVVAALYLLAGRLALRLAIPPGYATAVWPAAGIALAAALLWGPRIAPGVWLGSFLVNLGPVEAVVRGHVDARTAGIAAALGVGAMAQALAGTALVRRCRLAPARIEDPRDIFLLLALGGPLASVVSASVGVLALAASHRVAAHELAFTWFTWWAGDAIGCLVVLPLVLPFASAAGGRRRRATVGVPVLVGLVLVTSLYFFISRWEVQRQHVAFVRRATPVVHAFESRLREDQLVVQSVVGLFVASSEVSPGEFRGFTTPLLARTRSLALTWAPLVRDADRPAFETRPGPWPAPRPTIAERQARGPLVRAAPRAQYLPVVYLEPIAGNAVALGFDIASEPVGAEAVARALQTDTVSASAAIQLVQVGDLGVLIVAPLRRAGQVEGVVAGVLRVGGTLDDATRDLDVADLDVTITDVTRGGAVRLHGPPMPAAAAWWTQDVQFGGRAWRIALRPRPGARELARSWGAWSVLAAGLVLVALIGVLTLVTTGHTIRVEREALRSRQAEATQRLLLTMSETANGLDDVDALRRTVTTALGRHLGASRTVMNELDLAADQGAITSEHSVDGTSLAGTSYRFSAFSHSTQDELRAGKTVVVDDASTDPRTRARYRTIYQPLQVLAYIAVPLFRDGVWAGAVWVAQARARAWLPEEVVLVHEVATKAWLWSEQVRLAGALRTLNQDLERLVQERTQHLDAALREREVLLKEVHHRVKNNLQIISSLLGLQKHHTQRAEVRAILAESQARVVAIALVHEQLYRAPDLAQVDFGAYATQLAANLQASFGGAARGIELRIASSVRLTASNAIACGMIMSELVTNSFKHGFPDGRAGGIAIEMARDAAGRVTLVIADDGVGLPAGVDLASARSLGLELVATFAGQLQATVSIASPPGTRFALTFDPGA